jgi:mevalonate kinase
LPECHICSAGPFTVVVGAVPRERNTRDLVSQVRHQVETNHRRTLGILEQLGHLALWSDAINDAPAVMGKRANEAHTLLQSLGLSTPPLDRGLQTGLSAGAYGGKLSGAGGGGAFILFCENLASANRVALSICPGCTCRPDIYQWDGHSLVTTGGKES